MAKEPTGAIVKRRLYGVLFIVIVVGLVALSILFYNKAFTSTVEVELKADHTGNQLLEDSDVKIRGLIVGSVDSVTANGSDATVTLKLEPDKVKYIPRNVKALILPKTLFGEQYVSLIVPSGDRAPHIEANGVIKQDQTKGALEAQTVLDHLFPVLNAVRPADLNATLTAIATALNGRGEKLGETLANAGKYLKSLNPHTQELVNDLGKLGQVADEYSDALPNIYDTLSNLQTTVRTVVEKRAQLDQLFTTGTDAANTLYGFLGENRDRLIATVGQTAKIYPLLAEYSPEYPCLFQGINILAKQVPKAVHGGSFHLSAIVDVSNQGKYVPGNQPRLLTGYGPNCFGLPHPAVDKNGYFQIPDRYKCLNDGAPLTTDPCGKNPSTASMRTLNSNAENALVNSLVAGEYGTNAKKVPGVATVMAAPLLRGNEVSVK